MSAPNGDRVTNKQLYDELTNLRNEFVGRKELYAAIGGGTVLGQVAARVNLSVPSPPDPTALPDLLSYLFRFIF